MTFNSPSQKVRKSELAEILKIGKNAATREYKTLVDCINLGRTFLTAGDLVKLEIIPKIPY